MSVEPLEMAEEQDQSGFSTPSTPKLTPATSTDISRTGTPGPSRLTPSFAAASGGNEELEAFRQQWRKEVEGRNAGAQQGADAMISTAEARGGVLSTTRSDNNVPDGSGALLSSAHHTVRLAKTASSARGFGEDNALAADQLEAGTHRDVLTDEDDQEAYDGPHSPTIAAGLMSTPEAAKAPASWRHQPSVSQADEVEDVPPSQKAVPPDLAEARAKRAAEHARQDAQDLSTPDGQARIEQGIKLYAKAVTAEKRGHNSQGEPQPPCLLANVSAADRVRPGCQLLSTTAERLSCMTMLIASSREASCFSRKIRTTTVFRNRQMPCYN